MPAAAETIRGPSASETYPAKTFPPIVEAKENWSDDWEFVPELSLNRAVMAVAGHDMSSCEVTWRYGSLMYQWEDDFSTRTARPDRQGWWIRIRLLGDEGPQTIFVGRISGEARNIEGSDVVETGAQVYVVYGPEDILRKRQITRAIWWNEDKEKTIGWIPNFNDRNEVGAIRGNRSLLTHRKPDSLIDTYLFSHDQPLNSFPWTHLDVVEYILGRFVDDSDADGPRWTVGGQKDLLESQTEVIEMGGNQTAAEVIRRAISTRKGIDYKITPTDDGYEIHVFALLSRETCFGDATLPCNPDEVTFRPAETVEVLATTLVRSGDQMYKKIRVLGNRIKICFSLFGEDARCPVCGISWLPDNALVLTPKWSAANEASYRQPFGGATQSGSYNDAMRVREEWRDVYRKFGMAVGDTINCPKLNAFGTFPAADPEEDDVLDSSRVTLDYLPMYTGFDYTGRDPVDNNGDDAAIELLRPQVWIFPIYDRYISGAPLPYRELHEHGLSVSVLKNDVGVLIRGGINHLLAANQWDCWSPLPIRNSHLTNIMPLYDYRHLIATLAVESDQRVAMEVEIDGHQNADGVLEIIDDSVELWLMRPQTMLGWDRDADQITLSGEGWKILRSDRDRMEFIMAGAIARYWNDRCRATVTIRGLAPWGDLVGQVLKALDAGDGVEDVHAVITAVEWTGGEDPSTTIRTGFAD